MADLAREEADRYFLNKDHSSSHPEDRDNASDRDSDAADEKHGTGHDSDPGTDDDDLDTSSKMATMTQTQTRPIIPRNTSYANTGPKGVIADAQNFARAKQSTFRSRITDFANTITFNNKRESTVVEKPAKTGSNSEGSDLSEDDSDSEFMNAWRQNRLQELSSMRSHNTRRVSPSRRIWGTLQDVDANGYLDAIEKVSPEDVVVVMIYDPSSSWSRGVEDALGMLAYKHSMTRFVKLDHEIAEMETVEVPAVLAYRGGDVFATISGAKAEGLEAVLKKQGILQS